MPDPGLRHPHGWQDDAACRDLPVDLFFDIGHGGRPRPEAIEVCSTCPVRLPCLDYALRVGFKDGVFGGMAPAARVQILDRRTMVAKYADRGAA